MRLETHEEWLAVWTALQQYVDNNEPNECEEHVDRELFKAAQAVLERFDLMMCGSVDG